MSEPRESVMVPLPNGQFITQVEVYHGNPDKPERKAQLSPGLTEAKVKLAEGASEDDCLILVKQLDAAKRPISTYVYCCGQLKPYNPAIHVLGWDCKTDVEEEPEPTPEPMPEPEKPTLAYDMARLAEEEQELHEKLDTAEHVEDEPFEDEDAVEEELGLGDELDLGDDLDLDEKE